MKSRSKIALFQMSAILKFDFQKRKQSRFSEVNYLSYTKKDPILHVTTNSYPKTRGNKNKQWTHSTPVNVVFLKVYTSKIMLIWKLENRSDSIFSNIHACSTACSAVYPMPQSCANLCDIHN